MNKEQQLTFSPDFKQACEIFELDPWNVIQQFVDGVSLPSYFAFPLRPDRWPNMFMLECVLAGMEDNKLLDRYSTFLQRITDTVLTEDGDKETICRRIMDEWHKAVLEDRIKEVMEEKDKSKDK